MEPYNHKEVEARWQKIWKEKKLDSLRSLSKSLRASARDKGPFYNLMMFPYPSAEGLHVGNMYAFTGSDIYGRFKRMQGYDVFEPIGLDGFGIHSENYAFKVGRHPMDQAKISEKNFYNQLSKIGAMFDWERTVETYDPGYYRWTQWLFVQMFTHGLAYRGKAEVNWCPSCKTVLADEQVVAQKATILSDPPTGGESKDLIQSVCERCGNIVTKKLLEQWFFRITAYAEKLLGNIASLDWSEKVKVAQRNWIGKKEGINITYPVVDEKGNTIGDITCFTTRPDTNFGATFVVIAPEHPFVASMLSTSAELLKVKIQNPKSKNFGNQRDTVIENEGGVKTGQVLKKVNLMQIQAYIEQARKKSLEERIAEGRKKTGVFTGLYCLNQLNNYKLPLYISDFVLMGFGTGAVVGVPGHDTRDYDFAIQFDIPVKRVVVGKDGDSTEISRAEQVQEDEGTMINSKFLDGLDIHAATQKMMKHLEEKGWGKRITTYHLRDWLISRQRYWGPPIPMIYCRSCASKGKSWFTIPESAEVGVPWFSPRQGPDLRGVHQPSSAKAVTGLETSRLPAASSAGWYPVPEDQLPVLLPYIDDYKPGDDGVAPLAKHKEFYETKCPGCGAKAVRETDVSDTFLDSSWYFLRYPSLGGAEVDVAEVASSNSRVFQSVGSPSAPPAPSVKNSNLPKLPATELEIRNSKLELPWDREITRRWLPVHMYTGGAEHSVLHLLYSRFVTMALKDFGYIDFEEPFTKFYAHGLVIKDGVKMSKSKGNVVNPDEYIAGYGVDALRLYLMFMGPFSEGGDFRDTAMEGMSRWVGRVWRLALASLGNLGNLGNLEIKKALHKLVKKVTEDVEKRRYNTAIAGMMEFTNLVEDKKLRAQGPPLSLEDLKTFILLLAPFAPYLSEELWDKIKGATSAPTHQSVHLQPWPSFDPALLVEDEATVIVQINGKTRETIAISYQLSAISKEVEKAARTSGKVQKYLEGKTVRKVIFVSGKLINFVVV